MASQDGWINFFVILLFTLDSIPQISGVSDILGLMFLVMCGAEGVTLLLALVSRLNILRTISGLIHIIKSIYYTPL